MNEIRTAEIRASNTAGTELILEGMPIVFDQATTINDKLGSYTEIIQRGALDNALLDDTKLLYNHNLNGVPLAKSPSTMKLTTDATGVKMVATLPDTQTAKEIYEAVKRNDLNGMSFSFKVAPGGSTYDSKTNTRTILKIEKVYEVSVVPFAAYPQTSVEARAVMNQEKLKDPKRAEAKIKINQILKARI